MDLVTICKDKLAYFRIKELKDVLTQLGLSKQGKKQDLVDRILAILTMDKVSGFHATKNAAGKEVVAKLVDDTYRKMYVSGVADLPSNSLGVSDGSNAKLEEETEDPIQMAKIRCLCRSTLATDPMIKCEDPTCNVWQHIACVVIPEKCKDGVLPNPPELFYCEICRLNRADPFWETISHPLHPVKLTITDVPTDGSNPVQTVETTFQLTRTSMALLLKKEFDVQAWCMLLNDKVPFRMQWPQYADLQLNGVPMQAINRPGSQLLGANGRDDGPVITVCTREGINKISLTGRDARVFCLGVRMVKRRTLHQVLDMIPKDTEGESFEDAVARVRRCVGGGTTKENADSDSDIEVVADTVPVNLRCPMSGLRMKVAGRFKPCEHMGCFDLEVFVEMNQRCRKWQCPICLKNYSLEKIIIDPFFNRITSKMRNCEDDMAEIEVKADGSWRVKAEGNHRGLGDLGLWHLPDGTLSVDGGSKPESELKLIKREGLPDSRAGLKLGMKKNQNGCWQFNKPDDTRSMLSANRLPENFRDNGQNIIPMNSSATGNGRDGEDACVIQDGGGNFNFSTNNGIELDSISVNVDPTYGFCDPSSSSAFLDAELIVLSDSEEENEPATTSRDVYKNNWTDTGGVSLPSAQHGIPNSYHGNPALGNAGSSCLGVLSSNDDDFGTHTWSLPSGSQGGPGFRLFDSDADVYGALNDMQYGFINCPKSISGYSLTAESAMASIITHCAHVQSETMKTILSSETMDIPDGVKIKVKAKMIEVEGPRGTLTRNFKHLNLDFQLITDEETGKRKLKVDAWFGSRKTTAAIRTALSHVNNLITGVTKGYRYKMRFVYAHFPINASITNGNKSIEIRNFLGEKKVRKVEMLEGVNIVRSEKVKDELVLDGNDIELVSRSCALINQKCHVKNKDIRKFLDGIYVSERGTIVEEE